MQTGADTSHHSASGPPQDKPAEPATIECITTSRGSYCLIQPIGKGGYGVVWHAEAMLPMGQRRTHAIKFMRDTVRGHAPAVERFGWEAMEGIRVTENARHLVRTYDFGQCPKRGLFLVMELIDGPDLSDIRMAIRGDSPLHRRIAWDALHGLLELHGHGLIHRDVSLGNLLLAGTGVVKLADLGLVKQAESVWTPGSLGKVVGVSKHAAPEVLRDSLCSYMSDLYSLGAVLYELIAGKPPHGTKRRAILDHMERVPLPPLPPDTPADLVTLVHGLIRQRPLARLSCEQAFDLLRDQPRATDEQVAAIVSAWRDDDAADADEAASHTPSVVTDNAWQAIHQAAEQIAGEYEAIERKRWQATLDADLQALKDSRPRTPTRKDSSLHSAAGHSEAAGQKQDNAEPGARMPDRPATTRPRATKRRAVWHIPLAAAAIGFAALWMPSDSHLDGINALRAVEQSAGDPEPRETAIECVADALSEETEASTVQPTGPVAIDSRDEPPITAPPERQAEKAHRTALRRQSQHIWRLSQAVKPSRSLWHAGDSARSRR